MNNVSKPAATDPKVYGRLNCFVIFDPSSSRVSAIDVMASGEKVVEIVRKIADHVARGNDLKTQILLNRLAKINQMLELLTTYDNVIICKFFDKIWRRYTYISNIGEMLLDLETFLKVFPEKKKHVDEILALRLDEEEDEEEVKEDSHDEEVPKPRGESDSEEEEIAQLSD
jgi:hypothetical protein